MEGVIAIVMVFGIPIVAILTKHHQKLMEMKMARGQHGDSSVVAEIEGLRRQITEMRDTTTRYDLSFDAALQRIEQRVGHLEGRVSSLEQTSAIQPTNRV